MDDVIQALRASNEPVPVPLALPDDDDIIFVQECLLLHLPDDYRDFLKEVGDVVCGTLEPGTVTDERAHTWLPEITAQAWSRDLPRDLINICDLSDGCYTIAADGAVGRWFWGEGPSEEEWPSIWHWARDVWLTS
ncbi:MAG: SMI1/KNR4 family protein [Kistimonas sp.]|nr:SMI1/KNR4 family protein [Kistimonas sp.]